jgi:acyl-CoA thioesterase FadM
LHADSENISTYPLFEPVSIFTRSPLLETDYNLHKSNSTYFSDLDTSRSALMAKVLAPSLAHGTGDLEKEGHNGRLAIILGSVHTSFHKEIRPYELYEVRSRVLGWDKKWIVVASFFVRPGKPDEDCDEVLLASALSKYVVKKGRFTVSPERCFTSAGWLPPKPDECRSGAGQSRESSDDSESALQHPPVPPELTQAPVPAGQGLAAPIPSPVVNTAAAVVQKLENAAEEKAAEEKKDVNRLPEPLVPMTTCTKANEWDWHRIEMERIRGLRVASHWLALDQGLLAEYKHA